MSESKNPIRAIIVDDEPHARENLKMLVEEYCPSIEVVALAESATKAADLVEDLDPDLIFLDVMMPGQNGFAFLSKYEHRGFEVIFTTAHNEHALKAFKEGAVHYLEKPINVDDLIEAVARVERMIDKKVAPSMSDDAISKLIDNLAPGGSNKFAIPTSDGLLFVNYDEIIHLEAQDQYTTLYLTDGRKMLSSRNIKSFEDKLSERVFFRVHRSHIINLIHHLKEFHRTDGGIVAMSNGVEIPISRRKLPQFMERIQSL